MTAKQTAYYWREWAKCWRAIKARQPEAVADAEREALTIRALGRKVSSKSLSNAQFDRVLAAFRAVSAPESLAPQMANGSADRLRTWLESYLEIGHDADTYAAGMLRRAKWQLPPLWCLADATPAQRRALGRMLEQKKASKERAAIAPEPAATGELEAPPTFPDEPF